MWSAAFTSKPATGSVLWFAVNHRAMPFKNSLPSSYTTAEPFIVRRSNNRDPHRCRDLHLVFSLAGRDTMPSLTVLLVGMLAVLAGCVPAVSAATNSSSPVCGFQSASGVNGYYQPVQSM